MKIKNIIIYTLSLLSISCSAPSRGKDYDFQSGDLFFQDSSNDKLSEAIKKVTHEKSSLNFSHVGILFIDKNKEKYVIEAISKGVCKTPLDQFMSRSTNKDGKTNLAIARIKQKYKNRLKPALTYALTQVGKPYDFAYIMNNNSLYCSELIYDMFVNTGDKTELFKLKPMTFKNPDTNKFMDTWVKHYKKLNIKIPEGELGLNPNGMSKSKNIEFIYFIDKQ